MDLIVNFSTRSDADHKATTCETIIIRDLIVKDVFEVVDEIYEELENAIEMCFDSIGLPYSVEDEEGEEE